MHIYSKERGLRRLKKGVSIEDYKTKYPSAIETEVPDIDILEEYASDSFCCETPDGCVVEADGTCEHGYHSWLLILGYI